MVPRALAPPTARDSAAGSTTLFSRRMPGVFAVAALAAALAGCSGKPNATRPGSNPSENFKIGIMTGPVTMAQDDFHAGEQMERDFAGRVMHVTYPDNFSSELETVVAQLSGLAADPAVKVIIVGQAVPGSVAAARKIRETRPDVLIGLVCPHEEAGAVDPACDIAIRPDEAARGATVVESAHQMGARNFVHYSFPRHMSLKPTADRSDVMVRECEKRGMKFMFVTSPDPLDSGGLSAAQQFILADVPHQLERLGPATAFYATDDALQEPMIQTILEAGAGYFVAHDVAAPSQGLPAALGLKIPGERTGDAAWIAAEIRRAIAERGMSGHFGSWAQPVNAIAIRATTRLLVDAADKKADVRDSLTVQRYLEREAGGPVRLHRYDASGNQWLMVLDPVTY